MAGTRRLDTEAYVAATGVARQIRAVVAEQLSQLIMEADQMSSRSEMAGRLERLVFVERQLAEARAREKVAKVEGMAFGTFVRAQEQFEGLRREAVMGIALSCALWVAGMDYEEARIAERSPSTESPDE